MISVYAQVLKVLPCHGFDLVSFVYSIASSTIKMSRTLDTEFEEACKLLTQIVYQEMINLNMSAYLFPDPLTSESPFAPTSIVNIMSPFLVLRKMLQHIPGGFCGPDQHSNGIQQDTLEIHGIPSLQTSLDASATIDMYDRMHRKYIEFISSWSAGVKIQSRAVTRMPELLFKDRRFVVFDCAIDLKLYPLFKEQKDLVTRKIVFPLIVSTLLTNFKFVYHGSADRWYEIREAYVVAQCGAEQTPLTPLALQRLSNSHASYPEAGLFMGLRKAMDRLLCNADVAEDVDIYVQYLRYCQTVCTEQQIDGFYISERVRHCAQVIVLR